MSYRFGFQPDERLIVVVFEGEISIDEERKALLAVTQHPDFDPDARILVDRRTAAATAVPKDVDSQLDLAEKQFANQTDKPKLAVVVDSDYDYGMFRVMEQKVAARDALHDARVFRSVDEACSWLELDPSRIQWP